MSEHFMNRNGCQEQVRYYRQEPIYMRHLPWDFEEKRQALRSAMLDAAVLWACVIGILVLAIVFGR